MGFKVKIEKKYLIETITLELLILYGMFSRYLEITVWMNKLLVALMFIVVILSLKNRKNLMNSISMISVLFAIMVIIALNVVFQPQTTYLQVNLLKVFYPLCFAVFLFGINTYIREKVYNILTANFMLINLFWIVNLIVLGLQLTGSGFMIKAKWLAVNWYYLDQCCGLFGNSGTHELSFFTMFVIVYNLNYADNHLSKKAKKYLQLYTIASMCIMLYYSTQNDNTMLIALLPIMVFFYYYMYRHWIEKGFTGKLFNAIKTIVAIWIVWALASQLPFVSDVVVSKIQRGLNITSSLNVSGGTERLAIFIYALQYESGWLFGRGLGYSELSASGAFGYKHFGLSSIGSFTALGGIWYYLMHCVAYCVSAVKNTYSKNPPLFFILATLAIMIIFTIYSNVFTSGVSTIWIIFFFTVLGEKHYEVEKIKLKEKY